MIESKTHLAKSLNFGDGDKILVSDSIDFQSQITQITSGKPKSGHVANFEPRTGVQPHTACAEGGVIAASITKKAIMLQRNLSTDVAAHKSISRARRHN